MKAEWVHSIGAAATVIVLNGVEAIPDETDFSRTVSYETGNEINSTVDAGEVRDIKPGS